MNYLRDWLRAETTSRGWMVAGAVAVIIVNTLISGGMWYLQVKVDNDRAVTELVQKRSEEIRLAALDFQTFAAAYAAAVVDGADDIPQARARLLENVMRQYSTIDMIESLLPAAAREPVVGYKSALAEFSSVITDTDDVLRMRPFWEGAAQVLTARDAVIGVLG